MTIVYYASVVIGDGTRENRFRPEIEDEPGILASCPGYEMPNEKRAIVAVAAPDEVHARLLLDYDEAGAL